MSFPRLAILLVCCLSGCAQVTTQIKTKFSALTPRTQTLPASPPPPTAGCPHIPAPPAPGKLPKPPASDFPQVLQPGYWRWDSYNYSWAPPKWVIVVGRGKPVWVPSGWKRDNGACDWQPGHWLQPLLPANH
jgi:hypothetical protein